MGIPNTTFFKLTKNKIRFHCEYSVKRFHCEYSVKSRGDWCLYQIFKNNYKFNPISLQKVVWSSWLFKAMLICLLFTHEEAGLERFTETHICGMLDL